MKRYLIAKPVSESWLLLYKEDFPEPFALSKSDATLNRNYRLAIRLNYKFPLRILPIIYGHRNRTVTQNDFALLMRYIQKELDILETKINFR